MSGFSLELIPFTYSWSYLLALCPGGHFVVERVLWWSFAYWWGICVFSRWRKPLKWTILSHKVSAAPFSPATLKPSSLGLGLSSRLLCYEYPLLKMLDTLRYSGMHQEVKWLVPWVLASYRSLVHSNAVFSIHFFTCIDSNALDYISVKVVCFLHHILRTLWHSSLFGCCDYLLLMELKFRNLLKGSRKTLRLVSSLIYWVEAHQFKTVKGPALWLWAAECGKSSGRRLISCRLRLLTSMWYANAGRQAVIVVLWTWTYPPMVQKLGVLLVGRRPQGVVVKLVAIPGNNTCIVQPGIFQFPSNSIGL